VEEGARKRAFTDEILGRLPGIPVQHVKDITSATVSDELDMGKDILHLLSYKGEFLKPCPGTKEYICCGYQILNVATNCPINCSYCILQSYFNQPNLRVFVNLDEKIDQVLKEIDSWSDLLVPRFSERKNAVLELKTKTTQIDRLVAGKYRDRIIVSWSLNSPYISAHEEHKAASLKKRLEAARQCQSEGFILGFHFDPLIPHPNWKDEYLRTIELMDKYVDPKGIIWISMGSFRFMPGLKPIIRRRHPGSCVLDGEFITGILKNGIRT
jgi:spore photoproduct lyase